MACCAVDDRDEQDLLRLAKQRGAKGHGTAAVMWLDPEGENHHARG
jgi:hypothetical protein